MSKPEVNYDEASDTLYIIFESGMKATGIARNDHILLRIDKQRKKAVGLTLFEYSVLAQTTELGPRSFPLSGLAELPDELRELVVGILLHAPVSDILSLSAYTLSSVETIPITILHPLSAATA